MSPSVIFIEHLFRYFTETVEKTKEKKNEAVYGPSFNASFSLISSFQHNLGKCFLRMTEFEPHISCVGNNNGC